MQYQRLGKYIRPVDVRNRDLKVNLSQGICNAKYFQNPKQVADNPQTHKVVRTGQFAYNRATTRNGEKISIALREGPDCTVSSAYQVFEIIDENLLHPKYLMMWFKRPEFDRLAIYYSHGSAHEFFEWDAMCDVMLPVPSIERQREIVEEYETLTNRIRLNEQIIQRLEDTAQALYRKTFIDNIDKQNLPPGWHLSTLGEFCEINPKLSISVGADAPFYDMDSLPIKGFFICDKKIRSFNSGMKFQNGDVLFARITPCMENGKAAIVADLSKSEVAFGSTEFIVLRGKRFKLTSFLATLIRNDEFRAFAKNQMKGTDGRQRVDASALLAFELIIPNDSTFQEMEDNLSIMYNKMYVMTKETEKLTELQSLLLAKMGQ